MSRKSEMDEIGNNIETLIECRALYPITNYINFLRDDITILNAALDLSISKATGKALNDPAIQEHKELLITKVKEGKGNES
jgi:hypothetical protein